LVLVGGDNGYLLPKVIGSRPASARNEIEGGARFGDFAQHDAGGAPAARRCHRCTVAGAGAAGARDDDGPSRNRSTPSRRGSCGSSASAAARL